MASGAYEDGSKCPICFEVYKDPKALACLHSFCETCIHEYVIKSQEKGLLCNGIECPLCRFVTPIDGNASPETWARGLRTNFALASLLDSTRINLESMKLEEKSCQPCLLQNICNTASVFCLSCNERMCEKCKSVHNIFQFTKNHEFVDMGINLELSRTLKKYQMCEQHGKEIEFYCKDDDTICCSTCAIVSHRACKGLVEISTMSQDRHSHLQRSLLKKQIAELENTMKMSSSHLVNENMNLTKQATDLLTEWNHVREKVIQKLNEFEAVLKKEMKAIQETEASDIMVKGVQCSDMADEMRRFLHILELSEEKCDEKQQYIVTKRVYDNFKLRQSETEQKFVEMKSLKLSLVLSQPISDLLSMSVKGVSVNTESTIKYIPKCAAKTLSLLAETNIEQSTDDENEPYYTGLGFLNDDRIVAVDCKNKKCILMDVSLNKIGEQCLPVKPLSLAVTRSDCVVITTGFEKKLCFYQVNEDNTIDEKDSILVKYCCGSISLADDNKCVVSSYGSDVEPAYMLTFDGDFTGLKYDFGGLSFDKSDQSKCSYAEESSQLLVTEKARNTVHVFNHTSKQHIQITDSSIKKPKCITHYMNDLFFVCSSGTNSIVQVSSQGKVLKVDALDEIKMPYSISFSHNRDKMIVSNEKKSLKTLHLFKIQ